jgi:galactosamine-6-phosphate isomerase
VLTPQILPDHEAVSRRAADWLLQRIGRQPDLLLCTAAGSTPLRAYALLAEQRATQPQLFSRLRLLKLDEWGGLAMDDPATCEQHLRAALVEPLGLAARYVAFDSRPQNPQAECARVAAWLAENGPIDVCVLGLGVNGHLGFNEPATHLQPHCHVAELSPESLAHGSLAGARSRLGFGLTLGMADILQSRQILLLATGETKRDPLARLLSGRITTQFPASLLQLHRDVTLVCDTRARPAAAR